jgi:hypothetical protein
MSSWAMSLVLSASCIAIRSGRVVIAYLNALSGRRLCNTAIQAQHLASFCIAVRGFARGLLTGICPIFVSIFGKAVKLEDFFSISVKLLNGFYSFYSFYRWSIF